ncbi:Transmembrane component of energizing module of predicted tryptophan ECF transporter [Methanosarcina siciliae C2J]|uniref:Transmembrane component of energizing module of predicted tryptophan ECF transporter n=3 Tax=Methanosarcina siciliae TaxID=38027 RepID=A0A0E3PCS5_9EURY|nr:energy-coupling factor transporter transmembrane component T [Methanosarcina siciliae]AKB28425.1 Transmembrane component of energizing module of predicted tryptophan ECF transporter [Methanosarcina siciliae T4/M]AKB32230.1 Transmembrane component of energizing module of predicted tryptophan ECF transporter [Methanosarcina siciliae HI350]AKB36008.1 Transmembrane component of energizing module of predicted tryptophan ECF transporter [Methanosarcina siciliae C2J]
MKEIMQYINRDSYLHRMNPLSKIAAVTGIIALGVLTTNPVFLAFMVFAIFLASLGAGLQQELLKQVKLLFFLSISLILLTIFTLKSGETVGYLIPAGTLTAGGLVPITTGALDFGTVLSLRFFAMLFAFQLLVVTTKPSDLMKALLAIRVPVDYVLMFVIALRFIPSLQVEGQRIHEAQLARGYNPGTGLRGKIMSVKPILVPLVANSLGKTQVLGLTMDLRGYRSRQNVKKNKITWNKTDVAAIGCVAIMGLGVVLGGLM